ncbi:hypothetical protein JMUB6875_61330 [Nocardia sp. JMUB6875]|uniref:hypothetical protein n=1 Tax=Nocardia sp. JMUB6875 TaxID=3158170 RepID=UPI0032E56E1F
MTPEPDSETPGPDSARTARDLPARDEGHGNSWLDLIALIVIAAAVVALVVFGNAGAAVLTAAGGLMVGALRNWHRMRRP